MTSTVKRAALFGERWEVSGREEGGSVVRIDGTSDALDGSGAHARVVLECSGGEADPHCRLSMQVVRGDEEETTELGVDLQVQPGDLVYLECALRRVLDRARQLGIITARE